MVRPADVAVAATDEWTDPDGIRAPAGDVHGWLRGTNQTLCGLSLRRSELVSFSHIQWLDVQPESGRDADRVRGVCPRCAAVVGRRRRDSKPWTRIDPRP